MKKKKKYSKTRMETISLYKDKLFVKIFIKRDEVVINNISIDNHLKSTEPINAFFKNIFLENTDDRVSLIVSTLHFA